MTTTFRRYDTANYLSNEAEISAYLAAVAAENDPALTVAALSDVARARNLSQVARDADISREGLYKALSPDGNPSFATVARIAQALGLRVVLLPEERG
jgi:probable addiction module antidote protein